MFQNERGISKHSKVAFVWLFITTDPYCLTLHASFRHWKQHFIRYVERNFPRLLHKNINTSSTTTVYPNQLIIVYVRYEKFCFRIIDWLEDCLLCPSEQIIYIFAHKNYNNHINKIIAILFYDIYYQGDRVSQGKLFPSQRVDVTFSSEVAAVSNDAVGATRSSFASW
jgi:thiol-disulfide isomerase/thioredoxin